MILKNFKSVVATAVITALCLNTPALLLPNFAAVKTYKVGERFAEKNVAVGKNPYVTNVVSKDLSGDGKVDTLYVIGDKFDKSSSYYEQFYYFYRDGKTGKQSVTKLPFLEGYSGWGYDPVVELVKLDNDNVFELQFSSYSGGSGGFVYYNVASYKGGVYKQLLGQKELAGLGVSGQYVDGFKAQLHIKEVEKTWLQDLNFQKDMLIEMKTYNKDGKLLNPVEPWTGPLVNLKITDGYITAEQSIKGIANADYIGGLNLTYHFEAGKLKLTGLSVEQILIMN